MLSYIDNQIELGYAVRVHVDRKSVGMEMEQETIGL